VKVQFEPVTASDLPTDEAILARIKEAI